MIFFGIVFVLYFLKLSGTSGCCSDNPNRISIGTHLGEIGKALDTYSRKYENMLLMGDFNVKPDETNMKVFCNQ